MHIKEYLTSGLSEGKETFNFTVRLLRRPPMVLLFLVGAALNVSFGGTGPSTLGFLLLLFILVFWISYDALRKERYESRLKRN